MNPETPKKSVRVLTSEEILRGCKEVVIKHEGQHYRLQVTRAGKLILNK